MTALFYAIVAGVAVLSGLAGGIAAARLLRPGRTIRAESVDIVDRDGTVRARIATDDKGGAGLFLFGAGDEIRAELSVLEGAVPRLALFDGDGNVRASLVGDAAPALILLHKGRKRRVHLGLEVDGAPSLGFFFGEGRSRAEIALGSGGKPSLMLRDDHGIVRAAVGIRTDGSPLLAACDEKGKPIWVAPAGSPGEEKGKGRQAGGRGTGSPGGLS